MFGRSDPGDPPPPRELIAALLGAETTARKRRTSAPGRNQAVFLAHLTRLLVQIVRENGDLDVRDRILIVKLFRLELRLADAQLERIRRHLPRLAVEAHAPDALLADFRARFPPASRLLAAELCFRLAQATPTPSTIRPDRARRVAAGLGLEPLQRRNLELKYGLSAEQERAWEWTREAPREEGREDERVRREEARREEASRRDRRPVPLPPEDERAFALLGLSPDADFAVIRKTYRRLAQRYHPDAVSHLGEAHRSIATEKMQAINAAYARLERRFGKAADDGAPG